MTNASAGKSAGMGAAFAATLLIFLVAMDAVMMPIATSAIAADLKTNVGMVQATIALVSLVAAPLYITGGRLGDIHGKKRIFSIGLILYGTGTLAATLAPNPMVLIGGWSLLRGVAMALAIPASVGLIIASYNDEGEGSRAFAIYGAGAVAAALIGPLLMGFSADALSWRVPFGIETLMAAGAFFLALRVLTETEPQPKMAIDWTGTVINFLAISGVLIGSMLGGRYGWFLARRSFSVGDIEINPLGLSPAPLLIGLGIILIAFSLSRINRMEEAGTETVGPRPLFSLRLFDDRTFATASAMATLFFILTGAIPFIIPVFLQQTVGFDGMQTAFTMMSFSIGSIILGFASGELMQRMQSRTVMQIFVLLTAAGLFWLFAVVAADVTLGQLLLPMFVVGAGFGVINSQIPNIQLSKLSPDLQGEGSGFAETGKELGVGLGTAVIASIMFSISLGGAVDRVAKQGDISLTGEQRREIIVQLEDKSLPGETVKEIARIAPNLEDLTRQANVEAFQTTLGILVAILAVALLFASMIPKVGVEEATGRKTREKTASVSSRRI